MWLFEHNFKRTITKIFNKTSTIGGAPYKFMLGYIKNDFKKFNKFGEKRDSVNVAIEILNEALTQNKFRESDIDSELIKLIHESQLYGATQYMKYSSLINRILIELYGEQSEMYNDHTRSRYMIISSFHRFIEEKGEVGEALKRIVRATINVFEEYPEDDPELIELIEKAKQYR